MVRTSHSEQSHPAMNTPMDYERLFEHAPVGMGVLHRSGHWLSVNTRLSKLLGYSREELLRIPLLDLLSSEKERLDLKSCLRSQPNPCTSSCEYRFTRKTGDQIYCEVSTSLISADDEELYQVVLRDITNEKESRERLKDREAKLQSIMETVDARIFHLDADAVLTYSNSPHGRLIVGDFIGKSIYSFARTPEERERLREQFEECQRTLKKVEFEGMTEYEDGSPKHLLMRLFPILSEGNLVGFTFARYDVTNLKRALDKVSSSESRFRSIVEGSEARILTINLHDEITYSNQESSSSFSSYLFTDLLPASQLSQWNKHKRKALNSRSAVSYEYKTTGEEGTTRFFLEILSPIKSERGIIGFTVTTRDITELRALENKYVETLELIKTTLDATGIGTYERDFLKNQILWDDNTHRIFGLEPGEFMKNKLRFFDFIHPDDKDRVVKDLSYALSHHEQFSISHRIVRKDGEVRWINTRRMIDRDEEGNPVHLRGVVIDITAEKQQEEIKLRATRLEAQNKELKELTYITSHDLQTPLRTINNFSRLLLDDFHDKLGEEGKYYLDVINGGVGRMRNLILDLLAYSRISRENQKVATNLNNAISEMLQDIHQLIEEHNPKIEVEELPVLPVFETSFRLMFQNLVTNAIKFHRRGVQPVIRIGAVEQESSWLFYVKDNGIGIAPRYHEKIFQVFQRLHSSDEYEGTGIGLAHCRKVAHLHGGEICLESEEGKGASFFVEIPKE